MTLRRRLACLELSRPRQPGAASSLDLAAKLARRIEAAKAAGTFPQSLCDADLESIVAADDEAKGADHGSP